MGIGEHPRRKWWIGAGDCAAPNKHKWPRLRDRPGEAELFGNPKRCFCFVGNNRTTMDAYFGSVIGRALRFEREVDLSTKQLIGTLFAVIAAAGTPTLAQRSDAGMAWEHAARNCNAEMQKVIQPIWGESEVDSYRTCMTRQGFKE
jgi:hypothetical protein